MKKIARVLLMLTCVFVLTACGSAETSSEFQQSKENAARARADQVVRLTATLVSSDNVDEMLANYSNVELGDLYASTFAQYYSDASFMCEARQSAVRSLHFRQGFRQWAAS